MRNAKLFQITTLKRGKLIEMPLSKDEAIKEFKKMCIKSKVNRHLIARYLDENSAHVISVMLAKYEYCEDKLTVYNEEEEK